MTLIEIMLAFVVVILAIGGVVAALTNTVKFNSTQSEDLIALRAAQEQIEKLQSLTFRTIYASYNSDPDDDPAGPGTAPGPHFDVEDLSEAIGDEDGRVGRIEFPEDTGDLREDLDLPELGMPMDLNADGAIDDEPHNTDYAVLPVRVVIEWQSIDGPTTQTYNTVLVPR